MYKKNIIAKQKQETIVKIKFFLVDNKLVLDS